MSTHSTGDIPRKDGDLIPYAQNIYDTCYKNRTAWAVSQAYLGEMQAALAKTRECYDKNAAKETRNHVTAEMKKAACHELRVLLSAFIHHLKALKNTLPDADLAAMGISPRQHGFHEKLPVPAEVPAVAAQPDTHLGIDIYLSGTQEGHPTTYLSTPGCYAAMVQYKFEDDAEWQFKIITKKHWLLTFHDEDRGKYVLIRAAWLNPTLEQGEWCEPVRVFLS